MMRGFADVATFAADRSGYRGWSSSVRRAVIFSAVLLGFLAAAVLSYVIAFPYSFSADAANTLLEGVEMGHGNWRLHGWTLPPDNFATENVLGFALLTDFFGLRPQVVKALPALIWAGIVVLGTWLALRGQPVRERISAAAIVLTLLAFTVQQENPQAYIIIIGAHTATILFALVAFAIAGSIHANAKAASSVSQFIALGAVVLAGSFGDLDFVVICVLPLICTCLLAVGRSWSNERFVPLTVLSIVIATTYLARWLLRENASTGGFQTVALPFPFATFDELPSHVLFAIRGIAQLMGADFTGRALSAGVVGSDGKVTFAPMPVFAGPYIFLVRFPLVVAFFAVLWDGATRALRLVRIWPRFDVNSHPWQFLDDLLWISTVLNVSSVLVTTVITDQRDAACEYLLPSVVTGGILIARRLATIKLFAVYSMLALVASASVEINWIAHGPAHSRIASDQELRLVDLLEQHGLSHGYAGYWESSVTTVVSGGRITTLALAMGGQSHRLEPYTFVANSDWYRAAAQSWKGKVFFISTPQPNMMQFSQNALISMFGRPKEVFDSDDSVVNVYDLKGDTLAPLIPPVASAANSTSRRAQLASARQHARRQGTHELLASHLRHA